MSLVDEAIRVGYFIVTAIIIASPCDKNSLEIKMKSKRDEEKKTPHRCSGQKKQTIKILSTRQTTYLIVASYLPLKLLQSTSLDEQPASNPSN